MSLPTANADFEGGRCAICQKPVRGDERIAKLPEEDGDEWVHAQCAMDAGYEVEEGE
jgi:hypothetical protein